MREVTLHGDKAAGRVALVDDVDYDTVMVHRWNIYEFSEPNRNLIHGPYATANIKHGSRWVNTKMHKLLTGWALTDHRNGDGLDNRRENMREATGGQNSMNARKQPGRSSRFKGVSYYKDRRKWVAAVSANHERFYLGIFETDIEAALAYDTKARELFGEFARPNFGPGGLFPDVPAGAVLLDRKATAA
jgi:hypothetical protein